MRQRFVALGKAERLHCGLDAVTCGEQAVEARIEAGLVAADAEACADRLFGLECRADIGTFVQPRVDS